MGGGRGDKQLLLALPAAGEIDYHNNQKLLFDSLADFSWLVIGFTLFACPYSANEDPVV